MQENNSIGYHIVNAEKLIGRYILDKFNKKAQHRVSPVQVMIMKYLLKNQNKKIFQQDICDVFNLRRSTVSGILTTMEKNNIIIRKVARDDPRKNEIKLTKTFVNNAKEISVELRTLEDTRKNEVRLTKVFINNTKKVSNELVKIESILEQNFTQEEKDELIRLLKKLEGNLIEEERKKDV